VSTTAQAPGHPSPAELIERYAARSGRDVGAVDWYTAFAWFKLAVILEGIHARFLQRATVGDGFEEIGPAVPVLLGRAHGVLDARSPW
jgi:aminoglycoside phosphotransferase (APT) family kinase protein